MFQLVSWHQIGFWLKWLFLTKQYFNFTQNIAPTFPIIGISEILNFGVKKYKKLPSKVTFLIKNDNLRLENSGNRRFYQFKFDHKARMNIKMSFYIFALVKYANQLIILASTGSIHLSQRSKIHKII